MTNSPRFLTVVPGRLWKCAAFCGALTASAFATFCIVERVEWGVILGPIIGYSNILEDSAENGRSDMVLALTDASGAKDPDRTDIRLKPAHHWFWTALLRSESYGIRVNLKWRSDDVLDIDLNFGCFVHMTHPLVSVGPIHVFYHFTYNDKALDLDLAQSRRSDSFACQTAHGSREQNH